MVVATGGSGSDCRENACPNNRANAKRGKLQRPQSSLQLMFGLFGGIDRLLDGLAAEEVGHASTLSQCAEAATKSEIRISASNLNDFRGLTKLLQIVIQSDWGVSK